MLTSEEKSELQHLEKIDAGYTEKFRNKEEWTEEEKKEQQKVYARIHELNKKIKSELEGPPLDQILTPLKSFLHHDS